VNGKKVDIPSYLLKPGARVEIREKSRKMARIVQALVSAERKSVPPWLERDAQNFRGVFKNYPTREEVALPVQEQLIVELYSK
jgi:small subunit ribosomal protein S4